jgi:hypothetical protein
VSRPEIRTYLSVDIKERAPIEVVVLPPVGPGAAWLSNGTVYRSLGPSTDPTKLCQATDCVLSFSPNGELLAVLTWDSYNENRTLQVLIKRVFLARARRPTNTIRTMQSGSSGSMMRISTRTAHKDEFQWRLTKPI